MASKTRLEQSLNAFAGELLSFVQRASDSVNALKRTVEQRPVAGVQDFKECLDDLEQQVAEFTDEIQQLVGCTSDTTSLEELIGHCTAVYNSNRVTAVTLEKHLSQYGYQQPAGAVQEPENPDEVLLDESDLPELLDAALLGRAGSSADGLSYRLKAGSGTVQRSYSTPTSPVSKSGLNAFKTAHMPSRLGMSQPGSPVARRRAPTASVLWDSASAAPATAMQPGCKNVSAAPGTGAPHTQQKQHERVSFGTTSSTPPALLISPGVAALASKYATSSVGGTSVGGISLADCQPSTGPIVKHAACRDLSLAYSAPDTNSPNVPISGYTAKNSRQQQVTTAASTAASAAACEASAAAAAPDQANAAGPNATVDHDDTTGELYSSLIHSNLTAMSSRDVDMQDDQAAEPVTPPATSCPGTPQAPATAGRLPAEWHSKKMQELNTLQADLTITLSQMKRTPSRSRLAHLAAADSDDEQDTKQAEQQQQQPATDKLTHSEEYSALQCASNNTAIAAAAADSDTGEEPVEHFQRPLSANLQLLRQRLQEQRQKEQPQQEYEHLGQSHPPAEAAADQRAFSTPLDICLSSARSAGDNQRTAAAAASAAVSAAVSAAAAATADLESWMESLSKKYALAEQVLAPSADASSAASITGSTPMLHGREGAISPGADALSGAMKSSDSLVKKYAALAINPTAAADDQQHLVEDVSGLPPPAPSCSPKQQLQHLSGASAAALLRSSAGAAAVAAAAAARSSALLCSVASDMSAVSDGTPGKPRLAAALAAGMAAFHSALRMDCPSPLSPDSPANARLKSSILSNSSEAAPPAPVLASLAEASAAETAAELAESEGQAPEHLGSMVEVAAAAADAGEESSADSKATMQQQPQSVLTPATQQAIRYAVAAAAIDSARPKSSIRHPQPTTDMKRLEDMRGYWQSLHQQPQQQGVQSGLQQHTEPLQQHRLVMNLEETLAEAADAEISEVVSQLHVEQPGATQQANSTLSRKQQEQQASKQPSTSHSLRSGGNGSRSTRSSKPVPGLDLSLVQQQQQQQLTPRAARLLRRQQQQQEQQHSRKAPAGAASSTGVLRSVENLTNSASGGLGSASKAGVASPAARGSPATPASGGSARKQRSSPAASTAVPVKVKPVTEEEFSGLPVWCRGLLTVDVLNSALEELSGLAAGRAGKRSTVGCEGFTAMDLEMLGHSSSKSKTIVSCLHKLSRAILQRSAAGSNVYKLVGTPAN